MVHIAIMNKSWGLIPKILSGEKTIETRWYRNKSKPWDSIKKGEIVYFKNAGEAVIAKAKVSLVEQYADLDSTKTEKLLNDYKAKDLGTENIPDEIGKYIQGKKYAIIIHLKSPKSIKPFLVNKRGYGMMSAWICVEDLESIRIPRIKQSDK